MSFKVENLPIHLLGDGCIAFSAEGTTHQEVDRFAANNGIAVTFAPWHPHPQYRAYWPERALKRPGEKQKQPGLYIVDEDGIQTRWT